MKCLISIFFFLLLFNSCSKSPKCWGEDKNKGIIINSIRIDCEPTILKENYVITSDTAYQQIFTDTLTGEPHCLLPTIDFNNYSLLGVRTTGQCEVKLIREVISLDDENKYHYKLTVKSCGLCKSMTYTDNWVTVPKLPSGWTVRFEIVEK